jgi:hypothetical protein
MDADLDVEAVVGEFASSRFEDARLGRRLALIARSLASRPSASLPKVCSGAELEGAYRFFSNVRVVPEDILSGHHLAVRERAAAHKTVLVVHDTTDFSYRVDGERKGLGRQRVSTQTFFGHFSLVISADGARTPLGVAALTTWVRTGTGRGDEYVRWVTQAKASEQSIGHVARVIHVMDREADDYDLFFQLLSARQHFVVRSMFDRLTLADGQREKLYTAMQRVPHVMEREVALTRRRAARSPVRAKNHPPRAARTATLHFSAAPVTLCRPIYYGQVKQRHDAVGAPETLDVNVVRVWEPAPPQGEQPIEWWLVTNEPIDTVEQICAIVDTYRARWTIEEYFKALKTGCSFERRQLHDYESLINLLAVSAPIACHVLALRSRGRDTPEASAYAVLAEDEIDVLRALGRRPLPAQPTCRDVMLAIAALGGHIKYAPDPGWLTLSRGYEELSLLVRGWRAANAARVQLHSDRR